MRTSTRSTTWPLRATAAPSSCAPGKVRCGGAACSSAPARLLLMLTQCRHTLSPSAHPPAEPTHASQLRPRLYTLPPAAGEVEVHSFPDMKRTRVLRGHTSGVFTLAFDRQQRWMASGGADAVACLWDTQVGLAVWGAAACGECGRAPRLASCALPGCLTPAPPPCCRPCHRSPRTGSASAPSRPWTTPSAPSGAGLDAALGCYSLGLCGLEVRLAPIHPSTSLPALPAPPTPCPLPQLQRRRALPVDLWGAGGAGCGRPEQRHQPGPPGAQVHVRWVGRSVWGWLDGRGVGVCPLLPARHVGAHSSPPLRPTACAGPRMRPGTRGIRSWPAPAPTAPTPRA